MTAAEKAKERDLVLEELELIRKNHRGLLQPRHVVEFAKDPNTALHHRFEWDNTHAADLYRLEQARHIVRVYVEMIPGTSQPVRAFVSLKRDRAAGRGYRAMVNVLASDALREQLLEEARDDMEVFVAKYEVLKEVAGVVRAMKKHKK